MSDLKTLYESIDLKMIEKYVSSKQQEDLHLEFKELANGQSIGKDDRKNLAKAISGFANSDGGIVIWGISTKKDEDRVDAADEQKPIPNPNAILSEFLHLTGQAANPIVDKLLHKVVPLPDDTGFMATYVPTSDGGPHMAKLGEDRYYKRSGDSFMKMEHYEIADMFGRRLRPNLKLNVRKMADSKSTAAGLLRKITMVLGIENSGRGIARFPSIALSIRPPFRLCEFGLDGNGNTGLPKQCTWGAQKQLIFAGGSDHVVHIGSVLEVTRATAEYLDTNPPEANVVTNYRITAEGVAPLESEFVITPVELADLFRS